MEIATGSTLSSIDAGAFDNVTTGNITVTTRADNVSKFSGWRFAGVIGK
jgi:hypothetical protein